MTQQPTLTTVTTIVEQLAASNEGVSKKALKEIVDGVFTAITDSLTKGETVRINGIGTFKVKERAARTGRNPKTGEPLEIAASKAVSFSAAKGLKEAVKGS
jgi:DNA-binding protein HU-beta